MTRFYSPVNVLNYYTTFSRPCQQRSRIFVIMHNNRFGISYNGRKSLFIYNSFTNSEKCVIMSLSPASQKLIRLGKELVIVIWEFLRSVAASLAAAIIVEWFNRPHKK